MDSEFKNIKVGTRLTLDDEKTIFDTNDYQFNVTRVRDFEFENGSKLILANIENDSFKAILSEKSLGELKDYKVYNYMDFFVEGSREDHLISNPWLLDEKGFHEVIEADEAVYVKKELPEVTHDGEFQCFVAEYATQANLDNQELLIIETGKGWIEFYEGRLVGETAFTIEF